MARKKMFSENRDYMVKIGPKKTKVYERTLKGYSFAYSLKKGYKGYKIGFIGLAANELLVKPR